MYKRQEKYCWQYRLVIFQYQHTSSTGSSASACTSPLPSSCAQFCILCLKCSLPPRYVEGSHTVVYGRNLMSTSMLEVSPLRVGMVLRCDWDAWSMVKRLRQATNEYAPPIRALMFGVADWGSTPATRRFSWHFLYSLTLS